MMDHLKTHCSIICYILSGTKALYELEITSGKMGFIQLARTLEILLDTTFPKLIGQNFVIYSRSLFFGGGDKNDICIIHFS